MLAFMVAALSAQAPAQAAPSQLQPCPQPHYRTVGPASGPAVRNLTELPPGQVVLAVEKRVGGCAVNVLKRKDLAGNHVMVPAGPADVRKAPASSPSKAQRLPKRQR